MRKRAAHVRALGQPGLAGGQGHGRAAAGTAAGLGGVPGVEGGPEDLVEGVGPGPELGGVGLGHDQPAVLLQHPDADIRGLGDVVLVDGRAVGGPHPGHVFQVLDGHGQAVEEPGRPVASLVGHEPPGLLPGPVKAAGGQGVDPGVHLGDPCLGRVDQLQGADLPFFQKFHRPAGGQGDEFVHG